MVEHMLVSFVAVVALWTHDILLIKLIRVNSPSGNTYKTKIMSFWSLCCESEAILSKKFLFRLPGPECSYGKIFIPVTARLGPGFSHEHIEIFTNWGVERRDLRSRDIPVDRAYMKRPFKVLFIKLAKSVDLLLRLWVKLDLHFKVNNISYCAFPKTKF